MNIVLSLKMLVCVNNYDKFLLSYCFVCKPEIKLSSLSYSSENSDLIGSKLCYFLNSLIELLFSIIKFYNWQTALWPPRGDLSTAENDHRDKFVASGWRSEFWCLGLHSVQLQLIIKALSILNFEHTVWNITNFWTTFSRTSKYFLNLIRLK